MFGRKLIHQVVDDFGHLRDYGTDEDRARILAAGVAGTVEAEVDYRWYGPQHVVHGEPHPADRDNAREMAWEQRRTLEAFAAGEFPTHAPRRHGPPFFDGDDD